MSKLDEIEAKARAATQGRLRWTNTEPMTLEESAAWFRSHFALGTSKVVAGVGCLDHQLTKLGPDEDHPDHMVLFATTGNGPNSDANAQYIVSANPATTLALVAVARAAMARPWIDTYGVCRGCNFTESRYEGEPKREARHGFGCSFAALDAALGVLK